MLSKLREKASRLLQGNKLVVYGIKYIPIVCTALLTLHVALLLLHVYEPLTVGLSAVLLVLLLVLLSIRFKFCRLHKAMIVYMGLMTLCICIQKYDGFGTALTVFRLIMFGTGCVLLGHALIKCKDDECGEQ